MGATSAASSTSTMGIALGSALAIAAVVLLICFVAIPRWRKSQLPAADSECQQRPISTGIFAGKRLQTWDPDLERLVGTAPKPVMPVPVPVELRPLPRAVVRGSSDLGD
ncbi:hypothetical protein AC578_8901 [Pseudocercospora eumusae]|uniref:Uncharacterized protein n=1 Tax=Pseudocercospora eumusae TaxID=321146 RepID=A0A139HBI9_9PEZI|nr:hypothetical protein AC578_8901 [Pseudocercospora eumusae]